MSVFAFYQRNQARETARISTSKSLAAFALVEMDKDPELSLLLTTKSVKRDYFAGKDIPLLSESVFRQAAVNSRVGVAFSLAMMMGAGMQRIGLS